MEILAKPGAEISTEIRFLSGDVSLLSVAPSDVFGILGFLAGVQSEPARAGGEPESSARNTGTPRFVFRVKAKDSSGTLQFL